MPIIITFSVVFYRIAVMRRCHVKERTIRELARGGYPKVEIVSPEIPEEVQSLEELLRTVRDNLSFGRTITRNSFTGIKSPV